MATAPIDWVTPGWSYSAATVLDVYCPDLTGGCYTATRASSRAIFCSGVSGSFAAASLPAASEEPLGCGRLGISDPSAAIFLAGAVDIEPLPQRAQHDAQGRSDAADHGHPSNAKTDVRDAYISAEAARSMPHALCRVDTGDEALADLEIIVGHDDLPCQVVRVSNLIRPSGRRAWLLARVQRSRRGTPNSRATNRRKHG